ncbi:hypothetical protein TIFTF001_007214 [Ficus carica]|uniref:Uncharacterized protein n=1 Tax=Ficus carica TaxID=3494 RepID=A0AA88A2G6_FICCA|nr:hypothetical protein TIFTF001_007214 [Ficus carica]
MLLPPATVLKIPLDTLETSTLPLLILRKSACGFFCCDIPSFYEFEKAPWWSTQARDPSESLSFGKQASLSRAIDDPITRPRHAGAGVRAGPTVHVLAVVQSGQSKRGIPLQPAPGVHQVVDVGLDEDGARVFLPGTAEIRLEGGLDRREVGGSGDFAVEDGDAGVLVGVLAALGGEEVVLVGVGAAGVEVAVLEDDGGVAEDEVDGAVDVALAVELPEGVGVEGVLVPYEAALVEGREVRAAPERHRLVLARPRRVLEGYALRYEAFPHHRCPILSIEIFELELFDFKKIY